LVSVYTLARSFSTVWSYLDLQIEREREREIDGQTNGVNRRIIIIVGMGGLLR